MEELMTQDLNSLAATQINPIPLPEQISDPVTPVVPEKLTRKQIGQLRRQYFTLVHGTVRSCSHKAKFRKDHDPSNNCASCWAAYFVTCVDLDFIHTVLTTKGAKALVAIKGTKFTKMFHGFLSSQLLPALAAETKVEETPATIQGGTFGDSQDVSHTGVSDLPVSQGQVYQSP